MAGFNINGFRSAFKEGGVRPTQFTVTMNFPNFVDNPGLTEQMSFLARSAEMPESIIGTVEVPYFGRHIKVAGDRTFGDWSVRIIMDDFKLRDAFEAWHNGINAIISNRMDENVAGINPALGNSYKSVAFVTVFDKKGPGDIDGDGALKSYRFDGIFPRQIGPVRMDYDARDQIAEFDVLFSYDWYEPLRKASEGPIFQTELNPA